MRKTILHREHPIAYERSGSGLPVMLLHGFTEDGSIWDLLRGAFPQKYDWLIPDLPGSGASPFNKNLHSIADFAAAVKAVAEAEQIGRMTLIGHSMGGYISLAFAEKYPETLKGLGLFHSTAYADTREKKESRKKSMDFIARQGSSPYVRQSLPGLFSAHFKESRPEIIRRQVEKYANFSAESLVQYLEAMRNREAKTEVLKNLEAPVWFVLGEEDPAVPLQDGLEQCHLPRISYIHILTDTAHMGMLENTNLCNAFADRFLDGISL